MAILHGLHEDGILMKCTKRNSETEVLCLDFLIGNKLPVGVSNFREAHRPAVAPFSDENGMADDGEGTLRIGYPEEQSESEDEVMMDFVSGR
jgi:hypothetical protein